MGPTGISMALWKNSLGQYELVADSGTIYLFGSDGQLYEISDKNDKKISLSYIDGCIYSISTQDGRSLIFTKGANGTVQWEETHSVITDKYGLDSWENMENAMKIGNLHEDILQFIVDSKRGIMKGYTSVRNSSN